MYKGYDSANVEFRVERVNNDGNNNEATVEVDEIDKFLNGRYVGSTEACWRIFQYEMHFQSHTIIRLDFHLPGEQRVSFRRGHEEEVVINPPTTKLLEFFKLNQQNPSANAYLYTE